MKAKGILITLAVLGGTYYLVKLRKDKMKKDCDAQGGTFTSKLLGGECQITITT